MASMGSSTATLCVFATLVVVSVGRLINTDDHGLPALGDGPPFCHGHECPPFNVLKTTSRYQLRQYERANFVQTTVESANVGAAVTKGYTKLFRYISGNNVENAKIDMTSPVIIFEESDNDFKSTEKKYTIAFYLPQKFQGDAPAPKDGAVSILDHPSYMAYVKEFSGFGTNVLKEAQALRQNLVQDDVLFKEGQFAYAIYDPPTKLWGRHNEVWIMAADSSVASTASSTKATFVHAVQSAVDVPHKAVMNVAQKFLRLHS